MPKILFFPMGNVNTPSTRVRCYAFADELEKLGNKAKICGSKTLSRLPNNLLKIIQCTISIPFYDVLYFNKSAHPITYLLLKFAKIMGKKVILDIDDAEFLSKNGKWFEKFFKECDLAIVGSHFLLEHAKKLNQNVKFIPTCLNHNEYPKKTNHKLKEKIIIGWLGTESKYLSIVREPLKKLGKKHNIELRIITNLKETVYDDFENVAVNKIQWTVNTANAEIRNFDIGIMPLFDTGGERGKCAFKAIEYMASGVPTIVSGVGENEQLVKDGINGFIANTEEEWVKKIEKIIKNEKLRKKLAKEGLKTVENKYNLKKESERLNKIIKNNL